MSMFYRIAGSDTNGWASMAEFPKCPDVYSPLLKRAICVELDRGPGRVRFQRLPRGKRDVVLSIAGPLFSSRFVEFVQKAGLSGIEFYPVTAMESGKIPEGTWYRAFVTGRLNANREVYYGKDFDICPITGYEKIKPGINYHPPEYRIELLEKPQSDFFALKNIPSNKVLVTSECVDKLSKEGGLKFEVNEIC